MKNKMFIFAVLVAGFAIGIAVLLSPVLADKRRDVHTKME